ncbi:HNH endonuclease family protein [Limimaricola cinnabarinus]|uniref:HNH endonuclease family protein n=1 Tax=Limimaricola cinnabarinus TaxID=1125964 RepID=UPI0032B605C5
MQAANEPLYRSLLNDIFTFGSVMNARSTEGQEDHKFVEMIHNYSISLQKAVKVWFSIFNSETSTSENDFNHWLAKINRLYSPANYPVILSVMLATDSNQKRTEFLKAMERLLFLESLTARYYRMNPTTAKMLNIAIRINRGDSSIDDLISEINNRAKSITENEVGQKEIKEALRSRNYYNWRPTHYLLYEYNQYLQDRSKTDREKISWMTFIENENDYASIEHIYPQTARAKYWTDRFTGLTPANRDLLKNVIGNLLPLSKPKNAALSNKSFDEKSKSSKAGVGYMYGSYAENEVVALYTEWTPQAVLDRSLRILDFIEDRWGVNFGKDAEKINMLGLGFVKPATRIHPPLRASAPDKSAKPNRKASRD